MEPAISRYIFTLIFYFSIGFFTLFYTHVRTPCVLIENIDRDLRPIINLVNYIYVGLLMSGQKHNFMVEQVEWDRRGAGVTAVIYYNRMIRVFLDLYNFVSRLFSGQMVTRI